MLLRFFIAAGFAAFFAPATIASEINKNDRMRVIEDMKGIYLADRQGGSAISDTHIIAQYLDSRAEVSGSSSRTFISELVLFQPKKGETKFYCEGPGSDALRKFKTLQMERKASGKAVREKVDHTFLPNLPGKLAMDHMHLFEASFCNGTPPWIRRAAPSTAAPANIMLIHVHEQVEIIDGGASMVDMKDFKRKGPLQRTKFLFCDLLSIVSPEEYAQLLGGTIGVSALLSEDVSALLSEQQPCLQFERVTQIGDVIKDKATMEILSELQSANRPYAMVVSDVTFGEAGIVVTAHQVREVVELPGGWANWFNQINAQSKDEGRRVSCIFPMDAAAALKGLDKGAVVSFVPKVKAVTDRAVTLDCAPYPG